MSNLDRVPRPADLDPSEEDVAAWFACLGRPAAPPAVRARLLEALAEGSAPWAPEAAARPGPWNLLPGRGLRPAWLAAAAVLVALGAGLWVGLREAGLGAGPKAGERPPLARSAVLVEDSSLSLFHGLETFDRVGVGPGELIADWSR